MAQDLITIISFGEFDQDFLGQIAKRVTEEYGHPVAIRYGLVDLSEFFDPARRQYNGNLLLKVVDNSFSEESLKTFGLFSVDLFIPILTYIFGLAFLNGKSGIASVYRLSNARYGLPEDRNLLLERSQKEVLHELGHTFGLIHCHTPACVMASSTYVEDIDQKERYLCPQCRSHLSL